MDKRAVIRILIAALLLVSGAIPAHAWLIYHKPAFRGRVVDAETKAPIEGAVVVAVYSKTSAGPVESYDNVINVRETLTDRHGEFLIPSYTTVIQPLAWSSLVNFIIFKPGYGSFPNFHLVPWGIKPKDEEPFFSEANRGREGEMELWEKQEGMAWPELKTSRVTFGLVELPRLKTREERARSFHAADKIPPEFERQVPIWKKMLKDEHSILIRK